MVPIAAALLGEVVACAPCSSLRLAAWVGTFAAATLLSAMGSYAEATAGHREVIEGREKREVQAGKCVRAGSCVWDELLG